MMMNYNALSLLLPGHYQSRACNHNICLIQELMRVNELAGVKFKHVYLDFANIAILTNSAAPGKVQVKLYHANIVNMHLGETVHPFTLRYPLNRKQLSTLIPIAPLPVLVTRSASWYRSFSFTPMPITLLGQRCSMTG